MLEMPDYSVSVAVNHWRGILASLDDSRIARPDADTQVALGNCSENENDIFITLDLWLALNDGDYDAI